MSDEFPLVSQEIIGGGGKGLRSPNVAVQVRAEIRGDDAERACLEYDMHLAKVVGECLHSFYRGHFWRVEASAKQGVILITIPVLLGNWKYVLPIDRYTTQAVVAAGGEILERFNIPRSHLDAGLASFVEARKSAVSRASHTPPGGNVKRAAKSSIVRA